VNFPSGRHNIEFWEEENCRFIA